MKWCRLESPLTRRPFESPLVLSSALRGQPAFEWLITPTKIAQFYREHFERATLLRKHDARHLATLLSMANFEQVGARVSANMTATSTLRRTRMRTVAARTTARDMAPGDEACSAFMRDACMMRLLQPEQHHDGVWSLCMLLEQFLQCTARANAYLHVGSRAGLHTALQRH